MLINMMEFVSIVQKTIDKNKKKKSYRSLWHTELTEIILTVSSL